MSFFSLEVGEAGDWRVAEPLGQCVPRQSLGTRMCMAAPDGSSLNSKRCVFRLGALKNQRKDPLAFVLFFVTGWFDYPLRHLRDRRFLGCLAASGQHAVALRTTLSTKASTTLDFTWLFVELAATHFFFNSASLDQLAESTDCFLN